MVIKIKGDVTGSTGRNILVWPPAAVFWTTTPVPVERSEGGTPAGEVTEEDTVFDTFTSATVYEETQIELDLGPSPAPPPGEPLPPPPGEISVEYESKDESVQTINDVGRTTWVSNGGSRVVTKFVRGNRGDDVSTIENLGANSKIFDRFLLGSASRDSFDDTSIPIDGKVPSDSTQKLYSTFVLGDPPTIIRTTDPNFWGINLDLRSIIAQVNVVNWWIPGILITPSCFINAGHASTPLGPKCWWVDNNDNLYSRVVTDKVNLLFANPYIDDAIIDISLQFLDSPLPVDIPPAKILPTTFGDQLPSVYRAAFPRDTIPYFSNGIPSFLVNKERKLSYGETWRTYIPDIVPDEIPNLENTGYIPSARKPQDDFYIVGVAGDSGASQCLSFNVGGTPTTVVTNVTGSGFHSMVSFLDNIINDFKPGESISIIDLSSFTTFP